MCGCKPDSLPKLLGKAGDSWFYRWRKRFDVSFMKSVKHLKVSWEVLKTRVRVFLKNVFALRFLWEKCFPGAPMRWISWDQMPAWFNNTALDGTYAPRGSVPTIRELACHSRQRFTVCTCVDSASSREGSEPTPVGILFKAAPQGALWKALTEDVRLPDWVHIHTMANRSF